MFRDDIESFVYVLLHTAARHAPNSMKPSDRAYFLSLFDYHAAADIWVFSLVTAPFSDVLADLFTTAGYLYQSEDSLRAEAKHYAKKGEIDQTVGEWKRRMLTHDWIEDFLDESLQDPDWEAVTDRTVKHELLELAEDGRPSKKAKHEFTEYLTNVQDQRVSENT
ncbi:hypothetical protein BT96DRAFT_998246 [Gymnopus androsaceus JB14]|uniref:Uncharacterized protein n=1 Tax=Gymnopus androsaceus JB14 TaxID=1447944 RepID=A0A6A4HBS0_9AGAR|nr:hypothetical protein BT96DRAFT_998246 [Gymnopus androsaceus JB14]